ncbi:MAG: MoaD/ThiS family protein [Planctomyces sp.]|nr:MoaD/ThiS family protein [Planctomyces sp.]
MPVTVELFGIPRRRAGVDRLEVDADRLGDALLAAAAAAPGLADCLEPDGRLKTGCLANLNGRRFTRDPEARLSSGDQVIVLSADVGG